MAVNSLRNFISYIYICRRYLGNAEEKMARYYDGAWQKIIYVVLADKSLPAKNTFECEMLLPHTSIKEIKTIFYAPSKMTIFKKNYPLVIHYDIFVVEMKSKLNFLFFREPNCDGKRK